MTSDRHAARRATLRLSNSVLPMFLADGPHAYKVVKDALPADARIINCRMSFNGPYVELLMESDEFPETPGGGIYPEITPVMTRD